MEQLVQLVAIETKQKGRNDSKILGYTTLGTYR